MKLKFLFLAVLLAAASLSASSLLAQEENTAGYYATVELQDQDTVLYIKHYETKPEVGENILYVNEYELSNWNSKMDGVNEGYVVNLVGEGSRTGYAWSEHIKRAVLQVTEDFQPTSTEYWFKQLSVLEAIEGLENLNTAQVETMSDMFSDCYSLTSLDLSNFNTANVTNMYAMFYSCYALKSIEFGKEFTTSAATSVTWMFGYNKETALDLSDFKTEKWTQVGSMFYNSSLQNTYIRDFNGEKINSSSNFGSTKLFVGPGSKVGEDLKNNVVVVKEAGDIEIGILPEKTKYKIGEDLDLSGGYISIKVKYDNNEGVEETLDIKLHPLSGLEKKITGFDNKTSGKQTLSVPYKGETYSLEVEVEEKPEVVNVDSVTLDQTSATLKIGDTLTLKATVTPENATNPKLIWSSSKEDVASVVDGLVTALKAGSTVITVKSEDGEHSASCEITVKEEVSVEFEMENAVLVYPNPAFDVINFSAEVEYQIFGFAGNCVLQGVGSVANVSELPRGLYVVEYNYNGARAAKKVVLK